MPEDRIEPPFISSNDQSDSVVPPLPPAKSVEPPFITVTVPDAGDDYRRVIHRESVGYEREVYNALHGAPIGTRVLVGAWCYEKANTDDR